MNKYEIWTGPYHLGQGYGEVREPQKWGEEDAISFQVACVKYELRSMLKGIEEQEQRGYVDSQSCHWFYNYHTNSNSWIGKYYETKEEAQKACEL